MRIWSGVTNPSGHRLRKVERRKEAVKRQFTETLPGLPASATMPRDLTRDPNERSGNEDVTVSLSARALDLVIGKVVFAFILEGLTGYAFSQGQAANPKKTRTITLQAVGADFEACKTKLAYTTYEVFGYLIERLIRILPPVISTRKKRVAAC